MTLPVVGLHYPRNSSIQGDVSFGIRGEDQEVHGIGTPANLVLTGHEDTKQDKSRFAGTALLGSTGHSQYLAHHGLHDGVEATLWTVSVSGDLLLHHFLRETRQLLRQREHVLESELRLATIVNSAWKKWPMQDGGDNKNTQKSNLTSKVMWNKLNVTRAPLPPHVPRARVLHCLRRVGVHVRRPGLVHEGPEADAQLAGGAAHGLGQLVAQSCQALQVVLHGV